MSSTIGRMMPSAVVALVVTWCCWPYLDGPGLLSDVRPAGDLPRITPSMLSPSIVPAGRRDPFQPPAAPPTASTGSRLPPKPGPAAPRPVPAGQKPAAKEQTVDVLSGLVLGATSIQGSRRFALINGRICRQGEELPISGAAAAPWVVAHIAADKVLLRHRGQIVELGYRNPISTARSKQDPRSKQGHPEAP